MVGKWSACRDLGKAHAGGEVKKSVRFIVINVYIKKLMLARKGC
jgi:hypothetical protein